MTTTKDLFERKKTFEDQEDLLLAQVKSTEKLFREFNSFMSERQFSQEEIIKIIEKVCHSLGEPDHNGEVHIFDVDGMHWKELSEKFEKELKK